MLFFKRKLLYPAKRLPGVAHPFDELHKAYLRHLRAIKRKLPDAAWDLACLTFHDARVLSVNKPSRRELNITLEGGYGGSGYDFVHERLLGGRFTTLSFYGAKQSWVPETIVGDVWLYEEVNLSDRAQFDYQALLGNDEIRIQAHDVEIRSTN